MAAQPASPVSEKAKATFASTFKDAANVQWTSTAGLYQVEFEVNNESIKAWISEEGQLEAVMRVVDISRVSLLVNQVLQQLEKEGTISTIAEVSKYGELFYLVKVETEKHIVTYKVSTNGETEKISRKKK